MTAPEQAAHEPLVCTDFAHPNGQVVGATFTGGSTFQALHAARAWCDERGISHGSSSVSGPIGLLVGDFDISKWHNMSRAEQDALHGTISGDLRIGPVHVRLKASALQRHQGGAA